MSTVEDLYEDSGGLPNSLVFPRIEDIEAELDRTTVNDLRQGMTIQIVYASLEAQPNFAVPGMRKTFGMSGVIQEIDKVGNDCASVKPDQPVWPASVVDIGEVWQLVHLTVIHCAH